MMTKLLCGCCAKALFEQLASHCVTMTLSQRGVPDDPMCKSISATIDRKLILEECTKVEYNGTSFIITDK